MDPRGTSVRTSDGLIHSLLSMPPRRTISPPPSPVVATTGTPAKRRQVRIASNDNSGPMPIELFLYRIEDYRSSSEPYPLPLPNRLRDATPEFLKRMNGIPSLKTYCMRILKSHSLGYGIMKLFMRSKPGYIDGEDEQPLLQINVDTPDQTSTSRWSMARKEIKSLREKHGLGDVIVELIDPKRVFVRSTFPISPSHPVIRPWENVRPRVAKYLDESCRGLWTSVCIFKVGPDARNTQYMVVITVAPRAECNWKLVQSTVKDVVNSEVQRLNVTLRGEVGVDIVPGWAKQNPLFTTRELSGKSLLNEWVTYPQMGGSIGVQGSQGGGTLGGFFKLDRPGGPSIPVMLTNHHVVTPADQDIAAAAETHQFGVCPTTPSTHPTRKTIVFPAVNDHMATVTNCSTASFANNQRQANFRKEIAERRDADLPGQPYLHHNLAHLQATRPRLDRVHQELTNFPQAFGKTLISSGRAMTEDDPPHYIDWALVEAASTALWQPPGQNHLPAASELRKSTPDKYMNIAEDGLAPLTYIPGDPPKAFTTFGPLEKGEWYFKKGRTTGVTAGVCHGTEMLVSIWSKEKRTVEYEDGSTAPEYIYTGSDKSLEAIIINYHKNGCQSSFCEDGDSGALIFDAYGNCCGLLFASYSNQVSPLSEFQPETVNAGLVMPIERVRESIERKTTPRDEYGLATGLPSVLNIA
ncbi:MAG: hypothetical protein Q9184_005278 [Pyrenodesmia sp. 2 TL-2023]